MKEYTAPEMEVVRFAAEDVIRTSGSTQEKGNTPEV